MSKRIPKNTVSPCIYLDTAWKPSSIYSITDCLNSDPKDTIHSHFMTVTNTNHWQMITQNNT